MRPNSWQEDILKSPRGLSPDIMCPSPERIEMDIDEIFQFSAIQLDSFRKIDFADQSHKNNSEPLLIAETDLHKESEKVASNRKNDEDSSYRQSEDFSQGNKRENTKIPLYSKNKKGKKSYKKTHKINKGQWKRRFNFKKSQSLSRIDEQEGMKNLKSISKDVLSVIKKMKPEETLSNDDLAKKIMDRVHVDSKQDKNIRRRLYDAVNVLEAVGKVVKTGGKINGHAKKGSYNLIKPIILVSEEMVGENREIMDEEKMCEQNMDEEIMCQERMDEQQIVMNFEKIKLLERRVEEKKRRLRQITKKKDQLSNLIKRNSNNQKKQSMMELNNEQKMGIDHYQVSKKQSEQRKAQKDEKQRKIPFPIFLFAMNEDTKCFRTKNMFAYTGNLKNAFCELEAISHLNLNEKDEVLMQKIKEKRRQKSHQQVKVNKNF